MTTLFSGELSRSTIFIFLLVLAHSNVSADDSSLTTASSHAPIGVMGDHLHQQGEWMFSYRYMRMEMAGSQIGRDRVSDRQVVGTAAAPGQFLVVPTAMPMDMHMLGAMLGVNDSLTLMGSVSYLKNSMDHLIRNGKHFTTKSSGIGDTKISALIRLLEDSSNRFHLGVGVSLPTGSITKRDNTPAMANALLPYPMQIGSGTYDILPSVTYRGRRRGLSWGAQLAAVIRTGDNNQGYTLGDRISAKSWLARDLSSSLSASLGLGYQDVDEISGANVALNPRMIQTADTRLQAGRRIDLSIGLNYQTPSGYRFAVEYSQPISQDLRGPQLATDSIFTLGLQKAY